MANMRSRPTDEHLLTRVITSAVVEALLATSQIQYSAPASDRREQRQLLFGVVKQALGVFDFSLIPPPGIDPARAYSLSFEGPARGMQDGREVRGGGGVNLAHLRPSPVPWTGISLVRSSRPGPALDIEATPA